MPGVSVVIVTHNSAETIVECLTSLPKDVEVIVVDNLSLDATVEKAQHTRPDAKIIRNAVNVGFGAADNIGLLAATGEFALLLNPDAAALGKGVERLAEFMERNPKCMAAGGFLRFPDGTPQQCAANRLTLTAVFFEQTLLEKLFHVYWLRAKEGEPRRVAQVMGACMMMRKIDGMFPLFDESFFLYCEDTELCKRISERGEIWQVRDADFSHELGASSQDTRWQAVAFYNRGKELYFQIHHGAFASAVCFMFDRMGAFLRVLGWGVMCLLSGFEESQRQRVGLFWRVLNADIDPYPKRRTL